MTCKQCAHFKGCFDEAARLGQSFDPDYDGEHRCATSEFEAVPMLLDTDSIVLVKRHEQASEVYEAFDANHTIIGQLRLHGGTFTVAAIENGVYTRLIKAFPNGLSEFTEDERELFLTTAKIVLANYLNRDRQ